MARQNRPPTGGLRLPFAVLEEFTAELFCRVGTTREDARLMGELLVQNDLRCVFSHGTALVPGYIRKMLEGQVNPRPQLRDLDESPGALVIDGDGGLGYFPCYRGTQRAIAKARQCGIAAITTRNHYHFGAAGNYTRLAVAAGCIGIAMSALRTSRTPGESIFSTVTNSPISVAIPANGQPPIVLDMGGGMMSFDQRSYERNPYPFFKALGLSNIIQVLAGVLPGIYNPSLQAPHSRWESNQGSFIVVVDVSHFMPLEQLLLAVDNYVAETRRMEPLPGLEEAELAGGFERQWEEQNRREGVPISPEHEQALIGIAGELQVASPFSNNRVAGDEGEQP